MIELGRNRLVKAGQGVMLVNQYDTIIGRVIQETGGWEQQYLDLLEQLIERYYPQDQPREFVDAGANIGVYALALARLPGPVRVHAIEAQRLVYQMLNANLALNSITNVWCYNRVVAARAGEVFTITPPDLDHPANFGAFELVEDCPNSDFDGTRFLASEDVETIAIDSLELEHVALIKLDVEGMELEALHGARRTISQQRPLIFFERHKTDYPAVRQLLTGWGYGFWELPESNTIALRQEWKSQHMDFPRILL